MPYVTEKEYSKVQERVLDLESQLEIAKSIITELELELERRITDDVV